MEIQVIEHNRDWEINHWHKVGMERDDDKNITNGHHTGCDYK